ncbi:MAG: nuclease [Pseudomonadota bacterium]
MARIFLILWMFLSICSAVKAADVLPGPVPAEVLRVIDGDTVEVRARVWLNQEIAVLVRLADVDAPEIRRASCPGEKAKGFAARDVLADLIDASGGAVFLTDIRRGKYAGRVVAHLHGPDGADLGDVLMRMGNVSAYSPGAGNAYCRAAD